MCWYYYTDFSLLIVSSCSYLLADFEPKAARRAWVALYNYQTYAWTTHWQEMRGSRRSFSNIQSHISENPFCELEYDMQDLVSWF